MVRWVPAVRFDAQREQADRASAAADAKINSHAPLSDPAADG